MKGLRGLLENWIFGLFGWEEQTFITVRRLVETVVQEGHARIESNLTDYENGDTYRFKLEIKKDNVFNKDTINYSFNSKDMISDYDIISEYEEYVKTKQN